MKFPHDFECARSFLRVMSALAVCAAAFVLSAGAPAHAGMLVINATFDPSLSSADINAIQAGIDDVINDVTTGNPSGLTVSIKFVNDTSISLGESVTFRPDISYSGFRSALSTIAAANPGDTNLQTALNSLPIQAQAPVGNTSVMQVTTAEGRNLGFNTPGGNFGDGFTGDGEIHLNTSITFPPNPNNGSNYSLQAVATHEIDEVLGIGGPGSSLGQPSLTGTVGDLDVYRYSAPGVRSFDTSAASAYFSIDGGTTNLTNFNQSGSGDYSDWVAHSPAQVQDFQGTPGTSPTLGGNEITAYEAIGYLPVSSQQPVPEPASMTLLGMGGLLLSGFGLLRRKRSAGTDVA